MEENIGISATEVIQEAVEATIDSYEPSNSGIVGFAIGAGLTVVACGIALFIHRDEIRAYHEARKFEKAQRKAKKNAGVEDKPFVVREDGSVEVVEK